MHEFVLGKHEYKVECPGYQTIKFEMVVLGQLASMELQRLSRIGVALVLGSFFVYRVVMYVLSIVFSDLRVYHVRTGL